MKKLIAVFVLMLLLTACDGSGGGKLGGPPTPFVDIGDYNYDDIELVTTPMVILP